MAANSMHSTLTCSAVPVLVLLLLRFVGRVDAAEPQNKTTILGTQNATTTALLGTIDEERVDGSERNLSCDALLAVANESVHEHKDWRDWLAQIRHNESDFIEACEKQGKGLLETEKEMRAFLDAQKDTLSCPESRRRYVIVSIVFIVGFVLALIVVIVLAVLLYRK